MKQDGVLITLDKDRELRLSYKAIKKLKEKFGRDITQPGGYDVEEIAQIFYVALLHEDPDITFEKTEDLIDQVPIKYCMDKLEELMQATFGKPEDDGEPKNEIPPQEELILTNP